MNVNALWISHQSVFLSISENYEPLTDIVDQNICQKSSSPVNNCNSNALSNLIWLPWCLDKTSELALLVLIKCDYRRDVDGMMRMTSCLEGWEAHRPVKQIRGEKRILSLPLLLLLPCPTNFPRSAPGCRHADRSWEIVHRTATRTSSHGAHVVDLNATLGLEHTALRSVQAITKAYSADSRQFGPLSMCEFRKRKVMWMALMSRIPFGGDYLN